MVTIHAVGESGQRVTITVDDAGKIDAGMEETEFVRKIVEAFVVPRALTGVQEVVTPTGPGFNVTLTGDSVDVMLTVVFALRPWGWTIVSTDPEPPDTSVPDGAIP